MKKVQLDKLTGEEVKHLLEQNSSTGVIETLPDVIAFFQGIGTDETIEEYIKRIVGTLDVVPPNSVGTEQIVDDSVKMEDLNSEVKDEMVTKENRVTAEELAAFEV